MVAFANTTRHNLLSFQFVHGILILVLGIQVLQEERQGPQSQAKPSKLQINTAVKGCFHALCVKLLRSQWMLTSLLEMKVMKTSSLTVVVATLGPGASNSELPNFFQF